MIGGSLTSALFLHGYGCFVPDLTSFTAEPCEGARQPASLTGVGNLGRGTCAILAGTGASARQQSIQRSARGKYRAARAGRPSSALTWAQRSEERRVGKECSR